MSALEFPAAVIGSSSQFGSPAKFCFLLLLFTKEILFSKHLAHSILSQRLASLKNLPLTEVSGNYYRVFQYKNMDKIQKVVYSKKRPTMLSRSFSRCNRLSKMESLLALEYRFY